MGNTYHKDEAEMDYGHDSHVNVLEAESEAQTKTTPKAKAKSEAEAETKAKTQAKICRGTHPKTQIRK